MTLKDLKNTQELQNCLEGSQAVAFSVSGNKAAHYAFIQLIHNRPLKKREKGIMLRFLLQITGDSRQQLARLVQPYQNAGVVPLREPYKPLGFRQKYSVADIALLAAMDERYDTPSGAVIKKLCQRSYTLFGETDYVNIAQIAVSH